jgi:hypothetical protein
MTMPFATVIKQADKERSGTQHNTEWASFHDFLIGTVKVIESKPAEFCSELLICSLF